MTTSTVSPSTIRAVTRLVNDTKVNVDQAHARYMDIKQQLDCLNTTLVLLRKRESDSSDRMETADIADDWQALAAGTDATPTPHRRWPARTG